MVRAAEASGLAATMRRVTVAIVPPLAAFMLLLSGCTTTKLVVVTATATPGQPAPPTAIARTAPDVLRAVREQRPGWCEDTPASGALSVIQGPRQQADGTWLIGCFAGPIQGQASFTPFEDCVTVKNDTLEITISTQHQKPGTTDPFNGIPCVLVQFAQDTAAEVSKDRSALAARFAEIAAVYPKPDVHLGLRSAIAGLRLEDEHLASRLMQLGTDLWADPFDHIKTARELRAVRQAVIEHASRLEGSTP